MVDEWDWRRRLGVVRRVWSRDWRRLARHVWEHYTAYL